jgi:hypothetical protein
MHFYIHCLVVVCFPFIQCWLHGVWSINIRSGITKMAQVPSDDGYFLYTKSSECHSIINVKLFNHSNQSYRVKRGERIAQLVIQRYSTPQIRHNVLSS